MKSIFFCAALFAFSINAHALKDWNPMEFGDGTMEPIGSCTCGSPILGHPSLQAGMMTSSSCSSVCNNYDSQELNSIKKPKENEKGKY